MIRRAALGFPLHIRESRCNRIGRFQRLPVFLQQVVKGQQGLMPLSKHSTPRGTHGDRPWRTVASTPDSPFWSSLGASAAAAKLHRTARRIAPRSFMTLASQKLLYLRFRYLLKHPQGVHASHLIQIQTEIRLLTHLTFFCHSLQLFVL